MVAQPAQDTTADGVDALLEAARYDDMDDLISIAFTGVSLDSEDSEGRTALHMASANRHLDIVDYLICNGAAAQNGGNPVPKESIFNRTHKRNEEKGPFVDKKSKRTLETYTKLKETRLQSSGNAMLSPQWSSTFIPEVWAEASSGLKNGHSYGFGKSYSGSFRSSGTIPSNNYSKSELEQLKELKEELREMKKEQQEINDKISQLLAITRATHANFSGHHFSPGQYSSPQYAAPSPGQYPASASACAGQYPSTATAPYSAPTHSQYTANGSGQYPPPALGYYPAPPLGYCMTPTTQFHVPGNYVAPGQHPPVSTPQSPTSFSRLAPFSRVVGM